MPNFFDPVGSIVNQVLNALWSIVTTFLQNATQSMLTGAIQLLMASPWPDLSSSWYKVLWNNAFGFVLLLSFGVLVIHVILTMFSAKDTSLAEAVIGVVKNFGTGAFMLVLVLGGMALSSVILSIVALVVQSSVGTPDWGNLLLQNHDYSQADAVAQFLALNVTATNAVLLYIQATLSGGAIMMYLIWYLFAGAFGFGFVGKIFRSMLLALIFTQVFARDVQAVILGVGAFIMHNGAHLAFGSLAFALTAALCSFIALMTPPIMFVVLSIRFYKHERELDPKVIAQRMSGQHTREFSTQQLNGQRADAMTRVRDNAKEFGREVVRTAAVAATVAGIAKLTATILAKIPTPQTRIAALGVAGIGVVSKAVQNKAGQAVSNRISRVGRSRS